MKYANPDILVDTEWVAANTNNENVRVVEVDYDPHEAYHKGHISGAILMWWSKDINDPLSRDVINKDQFEVLMSKSGITPDTQIVLYGDFNNWFAAFALWVFKMYGHRDVRIMNGGRKKWELEDRPYNTNEPDVAQTAYQVTQEAPELRAYRDDVRNALYKSTVRLVDVRSPPEFKGEITAPPEYPLEGAQRAGHIPGATNIPWVKAVNDEDGTFKTPEELKSLYESVGITPDKDIIAYCRIGERSSHTWVVLKYLLGYPKVVNYDGSWTEWGNSIGLPVER